MCKTIKQTNYESNQIIATIVFAGAIFYQAQQKQESVTNISMNEVEALAQNEGGEEKIYKYSTWPKIVCYIYVGGVYAKVKKVDCLPGNEHPICSECQL